MADVDDTDPTRLMTSLIISMDPPLYNHARLLEW
jgi:hypothetical protein